MKIIFSAVFLLFSFVVFANNQQKRTEEVDDFKPHMLFHENKGCPTNSGCTEEMGKSYQKWIDTLARVHKKKDSHLILENLRKSIGVPIDIWIAEKASEEKNLIYWESPCRQHNLEGQEKIGIGVAMAKDIGSLLPLEKEKKIFLRRLYRMKGEKLVSYFSLRDENPLYLNGDKLVFQRSVEGHYYGLSINQKGALQIEPSQTPASFPQSIECPSDFVEKMKAIELPKNLYAGVYCQKTWNKENKKLETILVGWSCN